ncbi:cationic amino acid transporter 2, vacuolar-like [Olea europaea subsp. europaea]|uniref:Cationic amino acid transporter 2, vacuolar-like n=1 Tax=Olea europaea subsp. europaea TaxID=158383 RepID=A0A8S0PH15_OLEEU|nr:cationic amino acid transporter 2, vacuolar-like [Olea europaea subsp. europaea]
MVKKLIGTYCDYLNLWFCVLLLHFVGLGSTIGAGVYILVGTVAKEHSGPALTFSFLKAGRAAALSAFCHAELASHAHLPGVYLGLNPRSLTACISYPSTIFSVACSVPDNQISCVTHQFECGARVSI